VELGIFQGGSYALIDKLFSPRALLGVELDKAKQPVLDYVEPRKDRLKVLYETSQTDEDIILSHIDGDLDIVFDDASHLYEPTRDSFNFLFKRLKPGGVYYIEDWAWSHQKPSQSPDHPWMDKPAVTNFIFDLVASAGGHSPIASVNVTKRAVTIRKTKGPMANLDWSDLQLRGKKKNLI
jgi:SAM-dependent methyltransferase